MKQIRQPNSQDPTGKQPYCQRLSAMAASQTLRVVLKSRYDEQTFISIPPAMTALMPSSIRVQTVLVGLTSNNLSYCAAGDSLHWWSTFTLPPTTPAPFNDSGTYGVSPGWGYCIVVDSTIHDIELGRILYGFVPISSHAVDLQLGQAETMPDHWIETSPHRSKIMSLYQRYFLMPRGFTLDPTDPLIGFTPVMKPVWEAGYLLAHYVFAQDSTPIHPLGHPVSPWTKHEADLTDACIVCIAAGTKTSRSFLQQLETISQERKQKYNVMEITSSASGCERYLKDAMFQHKVVTYDQNTPDTLGKYDKFILLNFGGRDNALAKVAEAVKSSNPSAKLVCVQIGGEAKVYTEEDLAARRQAAVSLEAVQMNATGIKDEAMKRVGVKKYFSELNKAFEEMVKEQVHAFAGTVLHVRLKVSNGLKGEDGVEGCWKRLSSGVVAGDEGLVVQLNA